jgi:SAM-dependent methyltransferase
MTFKDHFSSKSGDYAAYRPTYPSALVAYLAGLCHTTDVALDAGCGTGQLSVLLADRFKSVIATDASTKQIESAMPHERVSYRVAPAERSGLKDQSVDLVTVAQAAHWFDLPAFYEEVRRVGKPGSVLALITYGVIQADPDIDPIIQHFYKDVIGPYWPPERRHVEEGYRGFDFPFAELTPPSMAITVQWQVEDLIGYADTWSAVRAAEKSLGQQPIAQFAQELRSAWGPPDHRRTIRFPLSFRIGRV